MNKFKFEPAITPPTADRGAAWNLNREPKAVTPDRANILRQRWKLIAQLVAHGRAIGKRYTCAEVEFYLTQHMGDSWR